MLSVGGKPVDTVSRLMSRLEEFKVGDRVKLEVRRGDVTRTVEVELQPGA